VFWSQYLDSVRYARELLTPPPRVRLLETKYKPFLSSHLQNERKREESMNDDGRKEVERLTSCTWFVAITLSRERRDQRERGEERRRKKPLTLCFALRH